MMIWIRQIVNEIKYCFLWLFVLIVLTISGCASVPPKPVVVYKDAGAEALKKIPDIDPLAPLDLSAYKNINWVLVENPNKNDDKPYVALSYSDYQKLNDLLLVLQGRITLMKVREQAREKIIHESLAGHAMAEPNRSSTGKVSMDSK